MQKLTLHAIGAALILCLAGGAAAAVVTAAHESPMLQGLGGPTTLSFPLSAPSGESRSSATRSNVAQVEPGPDLTASTSGDTLAMLIAGMAVMAIVVRRRWSIDR